MTMYQLAFLVLRCFVWEESERQCRLCKTPVELEDMQMDHIVPVSMGGTHSLENLQASHRACNILKGGSNRARKATAERLGLDGIASGIRE
jgi:5-methylcytosine-specific restriction endonuclease McrA